MPRERDLLNYQLSAIRIVFGGPPQLKQVEHARDRGPLVEGGQFVSPLFVQRRACHLPPPHEFGTICPDPFVHTAHHVLLQCRSVDGTNRQRVSNPG